MEDSTASMKKWDKSAEKAPVTDNCTQSAGEKNSRKNELDTYSDQTATLSSYGENLYRAE